MIASPPRKLIHTVAKKTGLRSWQVKEALVAALEEIKADAAIGSVMIRGFGTFHTATRAGCIRPSPSDPTRTIEVPSTKRLALRSTADKLEDQDSV
jgi:nucleoid DNA-binding protein